MNPTVTLNTKRTVILDGETMDPLIVAVMEDIAFPLIKARKSESEVMRDVRAEYFGLIDQMPLNHLRGFAASVLSNSVRDKVISEFKKPSVRAKFRKYR